MSRVGSYDEDKWQAESQVRDAIMNTPAAKKEVVRVTREIKKLKQETKQRIVGSAAPSSPSRGKRSNPRRTPKKMI